MKKRKICKIYLFRHGQTFYNRDRIFTGFKDSKLTALGFKQARVVAQKLKGKKFEIMFYTRLTRSKQTMKEVLKFHPECKRKIKDDRMIERCYGRLQGRRHKEIIKKYGKGQFDKWHRGFNVRPPRGESFADVEKRVRKFIVWLKKYIKKNKMNVAISSHGNSIRLFRRVWEGLGVGETERLNIPYDKVFVYYVRC